MSSSAARFALHHRTKKPDTYPINSKYVLPIGRLSVEMCSEICLDLNITLSVTYLHQHICDTNVKQDDRTPFKCSFDTQKTVPLNELGELTTELTEDHVAARLDELEDSMTLLGRKVQDPAVRRRLVTEYIAKADG